MIATVRASPPGDVYGIMGITVLYIPVTVASSSPTLEQTRLSYAT